MGLNLDEFLQLSPNELFEALDSKGKVRDEQMKIDMEVMRLQTFYLINLQLDTNHRLNDVKELMKFKWEEEEYDESKVIVPDWTALDNKFKEVR